MNPVVDVEDVSVVLDDRVVLQHVDLHVAKGEVLTVLGPNGSGKSTLIRALIGLVPIRQGEIRLFGTPIRRFRDWQRVGYVPQRTTAVSGVPATVREVVAAGRLARRRPFHRLRATDRDAVERAIAMVGLTERAGDRVDTLSGGQQQRVLVARAAAGDPDLLLLDEPNAGIDQHSQEVFAHALRMSVASGRTLLLVLHQLGPFAPLVDRAVVLDAGRVLRAGPLPIPADVSGMPQEHVHSERSGTGLFG